MKWLKLLGMSALVGALCACGTSTAQHLADARAALADGDYDAAVVAADAGLAGAPAMKTGWGLELIRLEALARSGDADRAKAQLEHLANQYAQYLPPSEYSATAQQLQVAGQGPTAIEVLDLGAKRFPHDPVIARLISESTTGSHNPAELEMLRSLGYIE